MTNDINTGARNTEDALESTFDTTGLLLAFVAKWRWFVASVIVCLIVGYFVYASKIPIYSVGASIYLYDTNSQNVMSMDASDPLLSMKSYIDETELEVMKSRNSTIKIVDSLNLAYTYYEKGTLRDIPLYENNAIAAEMDSLSLSALKSPILITVTTKGDDVYDVTAKTTLNEVEEEKEFKGVQLPFDVELSTGTVSLTRSPVIKEFNGTEIIKIVSPFTMAKSISNSLNIAFAEKSDKIIRISITTNVVKRGVDIINVLLDFYNRNIIEEKNRSAVQTEAFILDRLSMISGELKDVEERLQKYRQQHNVTDLEAQSRLNLSLQSNYAKELAEVDAEVAMYEQIERLVSSADSYEALPAVVNNQTLTNIIELYNLKVNQFNRAPEGSTTDNPLVQSLQDEITRDKLRILQSITTAKRALNTRRNSLDRLENKSTGSLSSAPTIDKGLQEIFREQQVKVNIYTFLLQRREEIALQKTMATNTARLIDDPTPGDHPVSPNKIMIFGLAFIIGLLIPAAFIYLRRVLFPVFNDQDELARITRVPVLGEICQSEDTGKGDKADPIVVGENVSTPVAELFRLLRNNISFTRSGVNSKVILITSTVSGEGKSFIASNLALSYALTGKKVVVVGLDLRRPMLAHNFGLTNQRGVTTYLSGQVSDLNSLLEQSKVNENLYVLPAGPVPPNPNELLMSANMTRMITQLRNDFDYVIIDSAPIGVISDSFLIMRQSDLQLYVTRANYTTTNSLKVLHQAVDSGKFSSVYIVLNGVNINSNSYLYRRYGEYGHYGRKSKAYGYGYGATTPSGSKKKSN